MTEHPLPPLNTLRAFEAAARLLSFTAAARELNMTQSAVSQQIKSLESRLGRLLFHRRPRALELTEAGLAYLPSVQDAFATLANGTRSIRGIDRGQVLEVRSNLSFACFWMNARIGRLFARHPWLNLNITTAIWNDEPRHETNLIEITFGRPEWDSLAGERLVRDHCFPVCAPEIAARIARPRDLLGQRLLDCAGLAADWPAWARAAGFAWPESAVVNLASTFVLSLGQARAGVGVSLAHRTVAQDMLAEGALIRPFDIAVPMDEAYYMLTPPPRATTPAMRAFREWLLEETAPLRA